MKIMKFGGTSLGNGKRILHAAKIIRSYAKEDRIAVVVSAMSGVTDRLIAVFSQFQKGQHSEGLAVLSQLYGNHLLVVESFGFTNGRYLAIQKRLKELFGEVMTYLLFNKRYTLEDYDYVISYGERLNCVLVAGALSKLNVHSEAVDSARLIVTSNDFSSARALLPETEKKASDVILPLLIKGILPVVTGFYGATKNQQIATFGRGGSDYSAAVLAYALDAQEVILWKEVDGIYSEDPKKEKRAKFLAELSYSEAAELARNGAKVLHPETMAPLARKKIVVWVKNTFQPELIGSKIWEGKR